MNNNVGGIQKHQHKRTIVLIQIVLEWLSNQLFYPNCWELHAHHCEILEIQAAISSTPVISTGCWLPISEDPSSPCYTTTSKRSVLHSTCHIIRCSINACWKMKDLSFQPSYPPPPAVWWETSNHGQTSFLALLWRPSAHLAGHSSPCPRTGWCLSQAGFGAPGGQWLCLLYPWNAWDFIK